MERTSKARNAESTRPKGRREDFGPAGRQRDVVAGHDKDSEPARRLEKQGVPVAAARRQQHDAERQAHSLA